MSFEIFNQLQNNVQNKINLTNKNVDYFYFVIGQNFNLFCIKFYFLNFCAKTLNTF